MRISGQTGKQGGNPSVINPIYDFGVKMSVMISILLYNFRIGFLMYMDIICIPAEPAQENFDP